MLKNKLAIELSALFIARQFAFNLGNLEHSNNSVKFGFEWPRAGVFITRKDGSDTVLPAGSLFQGDLNVFSDTFVPAGVGSQADLRKGFLAIIIRVLKTMVIKLIVLQEELVINLMKVFLVATISSSLK